MLYLKPHAFLLKVEEDTENKILCYPYVYVCVVYIYLSRKKKKDLRPNKNLLVE